MSNHDDDLIMESGSSGPGTPMGQSNLDMSRPVADPSAECHNTPPLSATMSHSSSTSSLSSLSFHRPSLGLPPYASQASTSQSKYAQLLAVIEDMGKDIRPTYAGNKTSTERLKRSIMHARVLVRECLMECDRAARN